MDFTDGGGKDRTESMEGRKKPSASSVPGALPNAPYETSFLTQLRQR